jgi:hypothetical protein
MAVPKLKRDLIVAQETLSKIGSVCKVRTQDPENFGNYFLLFSVINFFLE